MIYLTEGNTPLNEAYNDEIVQERNNTYQLTFRFPTSDPKWELLKEETFLTADDLHGEQDFYIFEVEKQQGYIQVYANQVISLLNNYIVSSIDVDRVSGTRALSALAGSITRANPFSFFSDIDDRHTLNIKDKNAMEVLAKDKHSILGQWGGDMVRNGYNLRLLKNGGSENESLFMYKKNLSSYQHKTSTKSLKTRITFKTTVKGEGEKAPDVDYVVVIDSPLLGKYSQIYEAVVEVNDQNVKDQASLIEYGKQYFRTSMCDMLEDNLEISVVGQSDVAVRMFDVVSIYHEWYGLDVRKKITKYIYSPMAKRLKSIGFGAFQSSLANAIGGIVNDAVLNESRNLHQIFEERLKKEIANADRAFDAEFAKREKDITDGIELAKAKAEEVKQELSDTINQRFDSFDNGPLKEAKRKAEEALKNAGASSSLAQEAKQIGMDSIAKLEAFKSQATSAQTALSGDLDALKWTITNDIRPKQAQAEAEIAKQIEALNKTKNELAGVKSAQATYEETTTRRLSELTNLANGKASKSELMQTAEELASRIANVKVGGRNYYRDSEKVRTSTRFFPFPLHPYLTQENVGETWTLSFDLKINEGGEIRPLHFYHYQNNRFGLKSSADITPNKEWKRFTFTGPVIFPNDDTRYSMGEMALYDYGGNNNYSVRRIKLEKGTLATDWSPAIEDIEGQLSTVESNFRQRADSLDAGVRSLTEGLRTKADISALNVTAENIRQSVKSLETDTQNKLDQKLSQAEFEVQASSIRQEILNSTKDKADKTLVTAEAGKLRTELSTVQEYVKNDSQRQKALQRYTREESAKQATAVRELVNRDFVGKSTYQEDVRGLERRFEAITNPQNGSIATQIATYKTAVDGRFADITSLIAGKANQTDFQRVKETSQLYERILGNTENGIADKVARMAMTNQLFQVEVGKAFAEHQNLFLNSTLTKGFLGNNGIINVANATQKEVTSDFISVDPNEKIIFQHWVTLPENGMAWTAWQFFDKNKNPIDSRKPGLNAYKTTVGKQHNINQITVPTNAYFVRFSARMYDDGLIKVEKGSAPSDYSVAPNDALEAVKTVQRQLAGSWAIQNINSAGDIISGINLGADGRNRFIGKTFHITGETLIDNAVIKSAMVDKLKTANFESGSVTTKILDAEAVTADKVRFDDAFIRKMIANEAFIDKLTSKQIFATKVESVVSSSTFLEAYQGRIGGFTLGQFDQGGGRWISGVNQFSVGMGNGAGYGVRTAFWANWGNNWNYAGPKAWNVNTDGKMYCRNEVGFYDQVDFSNASRANFYGTTTFSRSPVFSNGIEIGSKDVFGNGSNPKGGRNAVVWWNQVGSGSVKYWMEQKSDRRLKENITDTAVKALDKINRLRMVAFDFVESKKHEEIGLIAQEAETIVPRIVSRDPENPDGYLHIDYTALVPYLIKAIQELNQKIEKMEKTIA
nr:MAG TPA: Neck appendage protein [Caudoviricetes sp.]